MRMVLCLLLCLFGIRCSAYNDESIGLTPTAYKGRFIPLDAYARQWLFEFYHKQQIRSDELSQFHVESSNPNEFLFKFFIWGHELWDRTPLFYISDFNLKQLLQLDPKQSRFSYEELALAIKKNRVTNLALLNRLLPYLFAESYLSSQNHFKAEKIELSKLTPGLWLTLQNNHLIVAAIPANPLFAHLKPGSILLTEARQLLPQIAQQDKTLGDAFFELLHHLNDYEGWNGILSVDSQLSKAVNDLQSRGFSPQEIALALEQQFPFQTRLQREASFLRVIPGRAQNGTWYSLSALNLLVYDTTSNKLVPVNNFTLYPDDLFKKLQKAYIALKNQAQAGFGRNEQEIKKTLEELSNLLSQGYKSIAGHVYKEAENKALSYPTTSQLALESFYYRFPLIGYIIALYALGLGSFVFYYMLEKKRFEQIGLSLAFLGFLLHTFLLVLRSYILGRPPVSNMFETVIYVPWVMMLAGLATYSFLRQSLLVVVSAFAAVGLLLVLQISQLNASLENVQAVLDSQYWLLVHVLMIVASYGVFILGGILGHLYLINLMTKKQETSSMQFIATFIKQALYLGLLLLIPGTILGGVWAAQSWGRFWDWDPKESWAFISACIYLLIVHAYRFRKIGDFGLAVGSVCGLIAISFTWYGVNYILGTGMHTYGFGHGGDTLYYGYLLAEAVFLFFSLHYKQRKNLLN